MSAQGLLFVEAARSGEVANVLHWMPSSDGERHWPKDRPCGGFTAPVGGHHRRTHGHAFNYRSPRCGSTEESPRPESDSRHFELLMVDVDNFKEYNDAVFGHLAGSCGACRASRISFRECTWIAEDLLAKYGGDEFCDLSFPGRRERRAVGNRSSALLDRR